MSKDVKKALDYLSALTEWGAESFIKTKLEGVSKKRVKELLNKLRLLE